MKKTGAALVLFVSAVLLVSSFDAFSATDGVYWLYESSPAWEGTDANRTKAPSADYDYTYGDEAALSFTLPWPFPFYGQPYSAVNVDTNGNIWFSASGFAHSISLSNTGRGPVISAWNDDLSSYYYGGVFLQHKTNPERVVVQWQTETYSDEGYYLPNDFEVVLYPNGNVRLDYKTFTGSLVKDFGSGISRGDGTTSLNLSSTFGNVYTLAGRSFKVAKVMNLSATIDPIPSYLNSGSVTLSGTMTGTQTSVSIPGATIASITYPSPNTWTCAATGLSEGPNTVTVQTRDEAGNTGSTTATVNVDTIAPSVAITSPQTSYLATTPPRIGYTASDGSIVVKVDGARVEKSSGDLLDALGDGRHTLRVEATDPAGNVGFAETWFTIDTTPPTVTATPAGGLYNHAQTVYLSSNEPSTIYFTTNGSSPTAASTVYANPITVAGSTVLKYFSRDALGNSSAVKTETYTLDETPPALTISTLADGSSTNDSILNVSGTAADSNGIKEITINDVLITLSPDGSFSHPVTLTEGANIVSVAAKDNAGNQTVVSRTITLDQTAPALVIIAPADNAKTKGGTIEVRGSISEAGTVRVSSNGTLQNATVSGTTFSSTAALTEGINTLEVTATDGAANTATQKRTVTSDRTKPSLAVTEPRQDMRTAADSITIRGTVTDALTGVMVTITTDRLTVSPDVVDGAFVQIIPLPEQKMYAITVTAMDETGNEVSVVRNVIHASTASGDLNGDGVVDLADALQAMRIAAGVVQATATDLIRGDVAPLVGGRPASDGRINVGDVVVILRKAVGLVNW